MVLSLMVFYQTLNLLSIWHEFMSWNMSFLWNIHLAPADCPNTVYYSYHNFNWMPPAHGIKEALNRDKEQGLA